MNCLKTTGETVVHTEHHLFLAVGLRKRIGRSVGGVNDDEAMNTISCPLAVSVPPQRPLLFRKQNLIREICPRQNATLCHVLGPIEPWISRLVHSMPIKI